MSEARLPLPLPVPEAVEQEPAGVEPAAPNAHSREKRLNDLVQKEYDFIWRSLRGLGVPTGSADGDVVLTGQLDHLAAIVGQPNVAIQVLPYSAGIPPVSAGSFSILESRATGVADVVYLENKTRIFFVDAEAEVDRYERDFELLTEMALPPTESVDFIREAALARH